MHRAFQPHLKPDGLGIDYSDLESFDTKNAIEHQLMKQHPYWTDYTNSAIQAQNKDDLLYAITNCIRVGLDKKNPDLVNRAQKLYDSLTNIAK